MLNKNGQLKQDYIKIIKWSNWKYVIMEARWNNRYNFKMSGDVSVQKDNPFLMDKKELEKVVK